MIAAFFMIGDIVLNNVQLLPVHVWYLLLLGGTNTPPKPFNLPLFRVLLWHVHSTE